MEVHFCSFSTAKHVCLSIVDIRLTHSGTAFQNLLSDHGGKGACRSMTLIMFNFGHMPHSRTHVQQARWPLHAFGNFVIGTIWAGT